jgi:tight adherence protein B
LRAGLSVDAIRSILRKDAPNRLAEDAGIFGRAWFHFQRKIRMAALPIDARTALVLALTLFAALAALILFFAWTAAFKLTIGVIQMVLVVSAAAALGLPYLIISQLADRRYKRMEAQFPVALDVFVRALRAGHPVASALELLCEEMDDPIGSEFGLVSDEVAYGANLTDALLGMAERWGLEDIRMFVISLSLQSETGGNLAEILSNLSTVIRERASLYMKVRALSSEGRMTGWMLSVLPVFTLVSMFAVNPTFYLTVAADPIFIYGSTGLIVLYFIGVFTIRRMIDLKV